MSEKIKEFYLFDEFRLDAENPGLWRDGELVSIPPKALELLILLVKNHGEIVTNNELLDSVWKDTFVEVGNISYTVSLLRKTLGKKEFIKSVPRRGYRFTANVKKIAENVEEKAEFIPKIESTKQKSPSRLTLIAIGVFAVILLTSFAVVWRYDSKQGPATQRNIKSIAVLPFRNLNENQQNNALSLGLTSSLISSFGRLDHFTIRPLETVKKFSEGESDNDPLKFGRKLKVDAILEGTFQTENNRLRVVVRLLDVRDGAQIWAGNFDETEADIFTLQDKISSDAARSLLLELTADDRQILSKRYTQNAEAFRAYSRGRAILDLRNPETLDKAISEFQYAVSLDPTFALAYTGLSDAFAFRGNFSTFEEGEEYFKKAKQFALKSLELDNQLAEGYSALGRIKRVHEWDWEGAKKDLRRAIELNPNFADAYLYYSQLLAFQGKFDEAETELKKASEIDPISQRIITAQMPLAEGQGNLEKGFRIAEEFYKTNRESPVAKRGYVTFLYHKGEHQKVIELIEPLLQVKDKQNYIWYSLLAGAYQKSGNQEKSNEMYKMLEENSQTDTKALYSLAMNYAETDRKNEAFAALQKCFETREERMVWVKIEPRFANLRNDARFQELLNKMRLN